MARARGKATSPAKRRTGERRPTVTLGPQAAPTPEPARAKKRAADKGRKQEQAAPTRAHPRSTKRSTFEEPTRRPRRPRAATKVLTEAIPIAAISPKAEEAPPSAHSDPGAGRVMELHWGDDAPSSRRTEGLAQRWVKRGDVLLRRLAEHGAAKHEYRANLKEGLFFWVDPEGRVSAEAHARVLCSWSRSTTALSMAWADPMVRTAAITRVDGMPAERDDVDEEGAWRVAMEAAERVQAEYLYRVTAPHAWYFLGLSNLTFHPARPSFSPSTPVALVRSSLADARRAVESRAEPTDVVRERLVGVGEALLHEAEFAYRDTDWVGRLQRTGRRLIQLAEQLPRSTFSSIAAGLAPAEWLNREQTIELCDAIVLLEDEWAHFA
jgi:hypothetical protein